MREVSARHHSYRKFTYQRKQLKVWLKRILIGLVAVLIVALVGIAIFLLTFDPNAYKSRLEQLVYERYHRTLSIEGDIELSLFPRIGLAVQDVSLSDRDSPATFASIDTARGAGSTGGGNKVFRSRLSVVRSKATCGLAS